MLRRDVSSLMPVDGGAPLARCKVCGKPAAGPCARCRALVCGDCCELVTGGASTFAICVTCAKRGNSLDPGWRGLLGWIALVIVGLAAVVALLTWLNHR